MATQKKKMYKKPSSKKQNRFAWVRLHPVFSSFAVAVLALALWGAGYVIYHNYQVNRERAQFMAVKADLHELAQQIAREVGQPTQSKEIQDCNYGSATYGLGPLSCTVSLEESYKKNDISEFNVRVKEIFHTNLVDNSSNLLPSADKSTKVFIFKQGNLSCGVSYTPVDTVETRMRTNCTGSAMLEYFPVTDGSDYLP